MEVQGSVGVRVSAPGQGWTGTAANKKKNQNLTRNIFKNLQCVFNNVISTVRVPVTVMVFNPATWMVVTLALARCLSLDQGVGGDHHHQGEEHDGQHGVVITVL